MKKIYSIVALLLLTFSIVGCKDDENRNPCGLEGEKLEKIKEDNVRLFFDTLPTGYNEKSYILYVEGTAVLRILPGMTYDVICNFSDHVVDWSVHAEGIDVEIEGIRYKYLGFYPADRVVYDLVLTSIKRK